MTLHLPNRIHTHSRARWRRFTHAKVHTDLVGKESWSRGLDGRVGGRGLANGGSTVAFRGGISDLLKCVRRLWAKMFSVEKCVCVRVCVCVGRGGRGQEILQRLAMLRASDSFLELPIRKIKPKTTLFLEPYSYAHKRVHAWTNIQDT